MTASRRLAALPLLLIGLAALCAALVLIPWVVQAQSQEVTPTAGATGENLPAKPTNLQASAEHDSVTLTWTASTDQTVTHYAILRRHPDTDPSQVFHVIESNAGPRDQLHRRLGLGVEHVHLPGEVGQPPPASASGRATSKPTLRPRRNQLPFPRQLLRQRRSRNPLPLTSPRRISPPRLPMAAGST